MHIEQVHSTIETLLAALDGEDQAEVQAAYPPFRDAVAAAWAAFQAGTIHLHLRGQAVPRLMTSYITAELEGQLKDPAQWPKVRRELKNMQNLMRTVGDPEEDPGPAA